MLSRDIPTENWGGGLDDAGPYMLMERAFGGVWPVLVFVLANLAGLLSVSYSLNSKKALKTTCATTGYTMRRLRLSPVSSYITVFIYYLAVTVMFWAVAIVSLYVIGKVGLTVAGATDIDIKLALCLLRTEIGHALIPVAHPIIIAFNLVAVLSLACVCARSCYLSWHNGMPSAGVVLVAAVMFIVWAYDPEVSYILVAMLLVSVYVALSFGDVISREKRPKGDPFKVNKHDGIVDLDSTEYDDNVFMEVSTAADTYDSSPSGPSALERYGRDTEATGGKGRRRMSLGRLRRRFMPLGISLEKANFFFGSCIFIGVGEHTVFYGKYFMKLNDIRTGLGGMTVDADMKMPYFWDLQEHAYYGYLAAILLVIFLQAYWNYEYYNKKTKSVYVMKRLPNKKEYPMTIWVTPVIQAVSIVIIMVIQTIVDICLYTFATPDSVLHPDHLSHILPF